MNEKEIKAGLAPTPSYQYARKSGNRLYCSGQVPLDHEGIVVSLEDPAGQARRCLENLKVLLKCHGFTLENIVMVRVYVVGGEDDLKVAWAAVANFFTNQVPPASLLGVSMLGHTGQLVEIEVDVEGEC